MLIVAALGSTTYAGTAYTPWSKISAYAVGDGGLQEKYGGQGTGNSQWSDNNQWDEIGADCSGYVGKVWQMATSYRTPATNDPIYPSSGTWHQNGSYIQNLGAVQITPLTNSEVDRTMNAWAWNGHMGVFEGDRASDGRWKVWHAANSSTGIVSALKADSYFTGNGAKRFKRYNW